MRKRVSKYSQLFSLVEESIQLFVQEVNNQKLQHMATDKWSVKDVLCHIVFWQRYYAQNYKALAEERKPFIFTSVGGSTRNQEGVDSLKDHSKQKLFSLLTQANKSLYKSIVMKEVPEMNYTNRKTYTTEEFLTMIAKHIERHTLQIKRAKNTFNPN